jgi:hypothetical protein
MVKLTGSSFFAIISDSIYNYQKKERRFPMTTPTSEMEAQVDQLVDNLRQIGYFRRGTVNAFMRKCGKKGCVCNKPGHPGHGPQTTLTSKLDNKTFSRNLPSAPAIELVEDQIRNHDLFMEWSKKWVALNEKISDLKLEEALSAQGAQKDTVEKKRRRRSSRRSRGR